MTSKKREISIELSQFNIEEGVTMTARMCPYCKVKSNFDLGSLLSGGKLHGYASLDRCQECGTPTYFTVQTQQKRDELLDSYPKIDVDPDKELPEEVKIAFREAIKSLNDGNWNACVVMCRRALGEAINGLGAEGKDLFIQIDDLESKRKITPELKEWAHESRLGGKLGAHGTKEKKWAEQDDAEEVLEFSRWFFRYVYVLPKQLAERKAKVGGENVQQDPQTTA